VNLVGVSLHPYFLRREGEKEKEKEEKNLIAIACMFVSY